MPDARQALQTREAAAATAWAVYQRNVRNLSLAAICALAASEPIRGNDGSYGFDGGLGRPLAKTTLHRWLTEAREQFRDEYVKRPILDMLMEEDDRLEHLASKAAVLMDASVPGSKQWFESFDRHLRTLESRRKLLGIDRPQQIEVTQTSAHDDPATTRLKQALQAAEARKQAQMAEALAEDD
jgi:hypothetical protein